MADNYVQVKNRFKELPDAVQKYFSSFNNLIPSPSNSERTWEILIAYLFIKVEQAQYNTLYGIITKEYKIDKELSQKALDDYHMTRAAFIDLYEVLTSKAIEQKTIELGKKIQRIRNKVIHGNSKGFRIPTKRMAVVSILNYADLLNQQVFEESNFKPFGDIRGPADGESHDKETSQWMLIGMGFNEPPKPVKTKRQAAEARREKKVKEEKKTHDT